MKKTILVSLLISSLILNVGCKSKEDKDEATGKETPEEETSAEEETSTEVETTTTTGKIYAPSPEDIRPDNATKSSSRESSGFILTSAPSQIRTPRNR